MWLTPELQEHLVYWNNPLESGVVFGSVLVLMVAVKYMSLISVVANLGLALVTSTVAFRIYKSVLSAVKKTDDTGHPFKVNYLLVATPILSTVLTINFHAFCEYKVAKLVSC